MKVPRSQRLLPDGGRVYLDDQHVLARNSAGNNLNKNKTDHTWVQQDEAGVKCRLLAPVDPAIIQRGPMAKRKERGMPSQVYVLRKHREMHVSEAEPCTTSTNQHDGPVSGCFFDINYFFLLLFFFPFHRIA